MHLIFWGWWTLGFIISGAKREEVAVMNGLTVNLHILMVRDWNVLLKSYITSSQAFLAIYIFWIICLIWYLWCQVWQRNLTMMLGNWILVAVALRIFNYTWLLTLSLLSQNRPHISYWSGYPLLITSLVYVGWFFRVISQSQSVWLA